MYIVQTDLHVNTSAKTLFFVYTSISTSVFTASKSLTSQVTWLFKSRAQETATERPGALNNIAREGSCTCTESIQRLKDNTQAILQECRLPVSIQRSLTVPLRQTGKPVVDLTRDGWE